MKQLNLNQLYQVRGGVNDSSINNSSANYSNIIPASSEGKKTEDENTKTLINRSGKVNISGVDGDVVIPN